MAETVREARDRFLAKYGFDTEGYTAPRFPIPLGRWTLTAPNPGLLPYHDLHHVVTGFPATLLGECEISAYEMRSGGTRAPIVFVLCVAAILLGLLMAPKSIIHAWKRSKGTRNLYRTTIPFETLLLMTVKDLRRLLNVPGEGL